MKIKYAYFMAFSILAFMLCACAQTESEKTEQVETEQVETEQVAETEEIYEEVAYFSNAPQKLGLTEEEKYTYTQVSDEEAHAKIEEIKHICLEETGYDYDTWAYLHAFLALNRNCLSEEVINELTNELAVMADEYGQSEETSYQIFDYSPYNYIALNELILDDKLRHHAAIMDYFTTDSVLTDEQHLWFYENYIYFGNDTYTDYDIHDYERMPELRLIDVYYTSGAWHNSNTNSSQFRELCIAFDIDPDDYYGEFLYDEFQAMQE